MPMHDVVTSAHRRMRHGRIAALLRGFVLAAACGVLLSGASDAWAQKGGARPSAAPRVELPQRGGPSQIESGRIEKPQPDTSVGRESAAAPDSAGTSTGIREGLFHFTDASKVHLDPQRHQVREFKGVDGEGRSGYAVDVGGREVVIENTNDANALRKTVEHLNERMDGSRLAAISMLHVTADAAVLSDIKAQWGSRDYVQMDVLGKDRLDELFASHARGRMVFFGHVEDVPNLGPSFSMQDIQGHSSFEVPTLRLVELGHKHDVEVVFLGCQTYTAGAGVGVLHDVASGNVADTLVRFRAAGTRLEAYAALSEPGKPAYVNPDRLIAGIVAGSVSVRRAGDRAPVMEYHPRPAVGAANAGGAAPGPAPGGTDVNSGGPPVREDVRWSLGRMGWEDWLMLLLGFMVVQTALLDPLNQIVKYQYRKYGRLKTLKAVLGVVAMDVAKWEPSDPATQPGAIGGVGCLLVLLTPFSFMAGFWVGLACVALLVVFWKGQTYRELNKEFEP